MLDLSRPVGLICVSALHFVPDEAAPWGIIAQYRDGFELVAPGVVFMQGGRPDPGTHAAGRFRSFRAAVGRKP